MGDFTRSFGQIEYLDNSDEIPQKASESAILPCSTPDEFELMDLLAVKLGLSAPISQEERNMSSLYKRRVLKEAIKRLDEAWNKE